MNNKNMQTWKERGKGGEGRVYRVKSCGGRTVACYNLGVAIITINIINKNRKGEIRKECGKSFRGRQQRREHNRCILRIRYEGPRLIAK